jgi:hypothetical protein
MLSCTLLLCLLQSLASGADAYATQLNVSQASYYEANPVSRAFVTHGPALLSGYFAADLAGSLYAERRLANRGHRRMSTALRLAEIGGHGFGAYWSFKHYRNRQ